MRVCLLGGTGSVGSAVLRELIERGHDVLALARSDASAERVAARGALPVAGDMQFPEAWVPKLPPVDAVIHAACDYGPAMAQTERKLLDTLIPHLVSGSTRPRFIYTGGCWLFGATGDVVATEESPFSPLAAFAWMVPNIRGILDRNDLAGVVIHPAMVHGSADGVFEPFARDAVERSSIRVVGSESVRWPLVHRDDLAALYVLALERAPEKSSYLGSAVEGLPVGRIARAFARRYATPTSVPEIVSADVAAAELGEWARGYALDQQLSGEKARLELGWAPRHLDPEQEIARLP